LSGLDAYVDVFDAAEAEVGAWTVEHDCASVWLLVDVGEKEWSSASIASNFIVWHWRWRGLTRRLPCALGKVLRQSDPRC
jgi:hypothetical protein